MTTSTTILLVGGALAAGVGGLLYLRHKSTVPPSPCGALATIVGDIAGTFAGPADVGANANAKAASELACKVASLLPFGKIADGARALGGAITSAPGKVLRAPVSIGETLRVGFAWATGSSCSGSGRTCGCPTGTHSVKDHRGTEFDANGLEYRPGGKAAGHEDGNRVLYKCVANFPSNEPTPRRQSGPIDAGVISRDGNTLVRDHRTGA